MSKYAKEYILVVYQENDEIKPLLIFKKRGRRDFNRYYKKRIIREEQIK